MEPCKNCNGLGLIGNGPVPTDLAGEKKTCPDCLGTGQIQRSEPAPASATQSLDQEPEPVATESQPAEDGGKKEGDSVENSPVDSQASGGGVDSTLE